MKKIFYLILVVILALLLVQAYRLYQQYRVLDSNLSATEEKLSALDLDNAQLQADIEYFGNPENLAKEARAKLDYKKPGEKMMIVVPKR